MRRRKDLRQWRPTRRRRAAPLWTSVSTSLSSTSVSSKIFDFQVFKTYCERSVELCQLENWTALRSGRFFSVGPSCFPSRLENDLDSNIVFKVVPHSDGTPLLMLMSLLITRITWCSLTLSSKTRNSNIELNKSTCQKYCNIFQTKSYACFAFASLWLGCFFMCLFNSLDCLQV